MLFSAATIVALAASASAAVLPRSTNGSWIVSLSQTPSNLQSVTAVYKSDAHPEGLKASCIFDPSSTPVFYGCDQATFFFQYDGETLKLQHTIASPTLQTVYGEAAIKLTYDDYYKQSRGEGTVEVTKVLA